MDNHLWERLAVLRQTVDQSKDLVDGDVGKTRVQKTVYFLQEEIGVPLGYSFKMHYFGPYSDTLDSNLSLAAALGLVNITPASSGFGYRITSGREYPRTCPVAVADRIEAIRAAIKKLGSLETAELELYATIHFVRCIDRARHSDWNKARVVDIVKGLKPKFEKTHVGQFYDDIEAGLFAG